jgi:predicted alpha/beta superfamily hydrolase
VRDWAQRVVHKAFVRDALYGGFFAVAGWLLSLPLTSYQGYFREHAYGMATQTFGSWFVEQLIRRRPRLDQLDADHACVPGGPVALHAFVRSRQPERLGYPPGLEARGACALRGHHRRRGAPARHPGELTVQPPAMMTAARPKLMRRWCVLFAGVLLSMASLAAESTAQPNVSVLAPPLAMPGLNRSRTIRLYLPPSYASAPGAKRYPVIYMHDGQNLFDSATAYAGEWNVDETLNALARSTGFEAIVVGIDNGGDKRMTELSPFTNPYLGAAEGKAYLAFLVGVVKPMIDSRYRTLPDRDHTAIIGSSMGGLISHAALIWHPGVFGRAALFSTAYESADGFLDSVLSERLATDTRVYLYAGGAESKRMVPETRRAAAAFARHLPAQDIVLSVVAANGHNEAAWRAELEPAVRWLFTVK